MQRNDFPLPGTIPTESFVAPPEEKKVLDLVAQEDVLKVSGQNYAVLSMVVPDEGARFALKIRGVYDTLEEAERAARQISMVDPFFDVMVCELWKWLSLPPPEAPEGVQRHYNNAEFEAIMQRYFSEMRDKQQKAKLRLEQARSDAANNEAGPVQEDAVRTEIEFTKTEVKASVEGEKASEEEASTSSEIV